MGTKLERISQLSKENPDMVFTSVWHMINIDLLKECHREMDGKKAVGIDGVTKGEYEKNLEENLTNLVERLKISHTNQNRQGGWIFQKGKARRAH